MMVGQVVDEVGQDLRVALRWMRRRPLSHGFMVLCLALGIGTSTAAFSFVDAVFFRPLPYEDGQNLVMVWNVDSEPRDLLSLVLRWSATLSLAGVGVGLALGYAAGRALSSALFGIHPADPVSALAAGAALVGASLAAAFLPARGAMRAEPVEAMRRG